MKSLLPGLILAASALSACGGGSSSSPEKSAISLAGNWQMVLLNTNNLMRTEAGFFTQSGKTLNGGLALATICSGVGNAQGTVDGSNVSITVNQIAQTVQLTGTTAPDGSSMSGNYSILASGCGQSNIGTFTATRVKPLNGNIQATFTSVYTSKPVFDFAGTVSQGNNTGSSTANLSGTMTSTNASCFASASITGLIGGTAVVFNLAASDGTSLGAITGTITADASSMTGNYVFRNVNSPILQQCGGGDSGTVTMTIQ